jgi:hypothetical protein
MPYRWSFGSEKRPRGVEWPSSPHHLDLGIAISIEFRAKKVPDTAIICGVLVRLNELMDQVHAVDRDPADEIRQRWGTNWNRKQKAGKVVTVHRLTQHQKRK